MTQLPLTHASFFTGGGGLDYGLEQAGWRTVSTSEVDAYANRVIARHWPDIPNLGDIAQIRAEDIPDATLWSGGFPCQDLSVAGKRRGLAGSRSGLAFAFLGLVEQRYPAAILLENVPGLLSSHAGRDFGTLLHALVELGYGVAYRVLDAQYFGVPQRRRRVFVLGIRSSLDPIGDCAAEVLSVGARCGRHPATGHSKAEAAAPPDARIVGTLDANNNRKWGSNQWVGQGYAIPVGAEWDVRTSPTLTTSQDRRMHPGDELYVASATPDSDGGGTADGLAGWLDDRDPQGYDEGRFRLAGNGVVAPVGQWIGQRLRALL